MRHQPKNVEKHCYRKSPVITQCITQVTQRYFAEIHDRSYMFHSTKFWDLFFNKITVDPLRFSYLWTGRAVATFLASKIPRSFANRTCVEYGRPLYSGTPKMLLIKNFTANTEEFLTKCIAGRGKNLYHFLPRRIEVCIAAKEGFHPDFKFHYAVFSHSQVPMALYM